jgi:hypothetical protein
MIYNIPHLKNKSEIIMYASHALLIHIHIHKCTYIYLITLYPLFIKEVVSFCYCYTYVGSSSIMLYYKSNIALIA